MLDVQINNQGTRCAHEVCDAVEADELGYEIDGVLISDFATPEWFAPNFDGPYDHLGDLKTALQLLPAGISASGHQDAGGVSDSRDHQTISLTYWPSNRPGLGKSRVASTAA